MVRFLVVAEGVIFLPLHVKNMLRMEVRLEKGVRMELGEGHEYALVKVIADGRSEEHTSELQSQR